MIGPYDPPFDPWNRPPTRLVLPAALIRRPTVLLAKSARPASTSAAGLSARLVERYGGRRMVQDLWILQRSDRYLHFFHY